MTTMTQSTNSPSPERGLAQLITPENNMNTCNLNTQYNQFIIDGLSAIYTGNIPASREDDTDSLLAVIEEFEWRLEIDFPEQMLEYFHLSTTPLVEHLDEQTAPVLICPAQTWEAEVERQVAQQAQEQYEEYEANTTAELDAYLDKQLTVQAELTKMRPAGGWIETAHALALIEHEARYNAEMDAYYIADHDANYSYGA